MIKNRACRSGFIIYMMALHIFLFVLITQTHSFKTVLSSLGWLEQEVQDSAFYRKTVAYQKRQALNIGSDTVIFFGDSMIQGLNVSSLTEDALNFGIGGDTLPALLQRVETFEENKQGRGIVIGIGINNVGRIEPDHIIELQTELINSLSLQPMLLWLAILPTSEAFAKHHSKPLSDILKINLAAQIVCEAQANCTFGKPPDRLLTDKGFMKDSMHSDGIHLNKPGYKIWHKDIQAHLDRALNQRK